MSEKLPVDVCSEIGVLEGVILHTPGPEIENMTPENVERALYSDILNRSVALKEYHQFAGVLEKVTRTYQVKDLLESALEQQDAREELIDKVCRFEKVQHLRGTLERMEVKELATSLIEGIVLRRDSLTTFLQPDRYALRPLHNFFFTRDASASVGQKVLINRMANTVRDRESWIMESIFTASGHFQTSTLNPADDPRFDRSISIEGGDVLVLRHDVLLIGLGTRTSSQGIDFVVEKLRKEGKIRHVIVQELPSTPESFIHLDMVFTMLDTHQCMVHQPLMLMPNRYRTIHIQLQNQKVVSIDLVTSVLSALSSIGMDLEPVICGGTRDPWIQDREQWHSGANFFAFAPGKIIGYGRNEYTIEALNNAGFAVLRASDVLAGTAHIDQHAKCVVTIEGAELARGGGGARCMTMPVRRRAVDW